MYHRLLRRPACLSIQLTTARFPSPAPIFHHGLKLVLRLRSFERFSYAQIRPRPLVDGQRWVVWDWDQRRPIDVLIPHEAEADFIYEAINKFIDTIPPDVAQVEIDEQGILVATSS